MLFELRWISTRASQVVQWESIACQCRRGRFDHWVGKIPWSRKWQRIPIFLFGKFDGQRSLGWGEYNPRGYKELNPSECTHMHLRFTFQWNRTGNIGIHYVQEQILYCKSIHTYAWLATQNVYKWVVIQKILKKYWFIFLYISHAILSEQCCFNLHFV